MTAQALQAEEYFIKDEPYYEAGGDEIAIFEALPISKSYLSC